MATKDLKATAIHEAGHVVCAFSCRVVVKSVTIAPTARALGSVLTLQHPDQSPRLMLRIVLAGALAEAIFRLGRDGVDLRPAWDEHESGDLQNARGHARELGANCPASITALLNAAADETFAILCRAEIWQAIELVAEELLERTTLSGDEVRAIVEQCHLFGPLARQTYAA